MRKLTNYLNKNSLKCKISLCKNVNERLFLFLDLINKNENETCSGNKTICPHCFDNKKKKHMNESCQTGRIIMKS